MPDPAAVEGSEEARLKAFRDVAVMMKRRIDLLLVMPIENSPARDREAGARNRPRVNSSRMEKRMADVTIYHNPDCDTSRNTLAILRHADIEPKVVESTAPRAPP